MYICIYHMFYTTSDEPILIGQYSQLRRLRMFSLWKYVFFIIGLTILYVLSRSLVFPLKGVNILTLFIPSWLKIAWTAARECIFFAQMEAAGNSIIINTQTKKLTGCWIIQLLLFSFFMHKKFGIAHNIYHSLVTR